MRILRRARPAVLVYYALAKPLEDLQGSNLTAADGGAEGPSYSRRGLECLDCLANNLQLLRFFLAAGRRQADTVWHIVSRGRKT